MISSPSSEQASKIDEFWQAFLKEEAAWQHLTQLEKFEAINELAKQYYPNLAFEVFDLDEQKGVAGLCITAHGNVEQFPLLIDLAHSAPPLAHYKIHAFRSRTKKDSANFIMGMAGFELRPSDVLIGYYSGGLQAGIEIRFASAIPPEQEKHARQMAFIMLDHFIGEYDFAVKVGPVKFVEAWSDGIRGPASLDKFPPLFDRFWTEELGHTGLFPSPNDQKWAVLRMNLSSDSTRGDGSEEKALVLLHESAKTLAMRADLSLAMTLTLGISGKAELDFVQEKQDRIGEIVQQRQIGILALTMLKQGHRHAVYYVSDRDAVRKLIEQTMGSKPFELQAEHDFKWSKYRYFAELPRREWQD
jgi:hypothetical protein